MAEVLVFLGGLVLRFAVELVASWFWSSLWEPRTDSWFLRYL